MQFHEYINLRNQMAKFGHNDEARKSVKGVTSQEYRTRYYEAAVECYSNAPTTAEREENYRRATKAAAEEAWVQNQRPFYNVWPITLTLAREVKLDLPFTAIEIPFDSLLLRFPYGQEPHNVASTMLLWAKEADKKSHVHVLCYFPGTMDNIYIRYEYKPEDQVQNWLDAVLVDLQEQSWQSMAPAHQNFNPATGPLMIRLCVFIGLLANDRDMITPVVLSKDQTKYDSTDDPDARKWLEDRAARKLGRGFDVGKKLQEQKEKSPHWRNPHLALFWTGPGRSKPIIKMRSGAVVQRVSMAEVPTGYLGPETEEEDTLEEDTAQREPVSKAKRFEIMKRDDYRCQLCGRSQSDGVKLHVDHRIPRVKGGSNEDDNLWTLCEDCNLGKSDKDL
jgi:hypothetical protein